LDVKPEEVFRRHVARLIALTLSDKRVQSVIGRG
jgi:hypothetical protein